MQDNNGDSYYIDLDSIRRGSSDTVSIMRKVEPKDPSAYSSLISNVEMDCKGKRIRVVKETAYARSGEGRTNPGDDTWRDVNPEGTDELLLELVCSLKKTED